MKKVKLLLALCIISFLISGFTSIQIKSVSAQLPYNVTLTAENLTLKNLTVSDGNYIGEIHSTSQFYACPESISVKMGGEDLVFGRNYFYGYNGVWGVLHIYNVNADVEIIATAQKYIYEVTKPAFDIGWSIDKQSAVAGEDFNATITLQEGFSYNPNFTDLTDLTDIIIGNTLLNYQYEEYYSFDKETGSLFIEGELITGNISISIETIANKGTPVEVKLYDDLAMELSNTQAIAGEDYVTDVKVNTGYTILGDVRVDVNGWPIDENSYTFDYENLKLTVSGEQICGLVRIYFEIEYVKYTISFTGENITQTSTKTTFTVAEPNYIITLKANTGYTLPDDVTLLIDGKLGVKNEDYLYDRDDDEATIHAVTFGNYQIQADGVIKTYEVKFSNEYATLNGESIARQNSDYIATIVADIGYGFSSIRIEVGGETINSYYFNHITGELIIYGSAITGEIIIDVEIEKGLRVDFTGENVSLKGERIAYVGAEYTASFETQPNYYLPNKIQVKIGGIEAQSGIDYDYNPVDKTICINGHNGDIEIYIKAVHDHSGTEHTSGIYLANEKHSFICTVCNEEGEESCNMNVEATCVKGASCDKCGYEVNNELNENGHDMSNPGCYLPATCKNGCGYTEGIALGHSWKEKNASGKRECLNCDLILFPDFEFLTSVYPTILQSGFPQAEIKNLFPQELSVKYENGKYLIKDVGADYVKGFLGSDGNRTNLTFIDGYWAYEVDETIYSNGSDYIYIEFFGKTELYTWVMTYRDGEANGALEITNNKGNESIFLYYYSQNEIEFFYQINGREFRDEYHNGMFYSQEVKDTINGDIFNITYDANGNVTLCAVHIGSWFYYWPEKGWSTSYVYSQSDACDAPTGYETANVEFFASACPTNINCKHDEYLVADCENPERCSVCGIVKEGTVPIGHDYDEGVITKVAKCNQDGIKTYTCKNDSSHTYTENLGRADHQFLNDCDAECNVCGEDRSVSDHVDSNGDHYCDKCNVLLNECINENGDAKCDICGEKMSSGSPVVIVIISVTALGGIGFLVYFLIKRKKLKV